MKQPDPGTMLVGHPAVAAPCALGAMGVIYLCIQQPGWWPIGLGAVFIAAKVLRLADMREKYLAWKREWDAMDGGGSEPRSAQRKRPVLGYIALALVLLYCAGNLDDQLCRLALVWTVIVVSIFGGSRLVMRNRPAARSKSKAAVFEICIGGPLMGVPSIKDAYRALPRHCQTVLRA
jgi:hypothetical protein